MKKRIIATAFLMALASVSISGCGNSKMPGGVIGSADGKTDIVVSTETQTNINSGTDAGTAPQTGANSGTDAGTTTQGGITEDDAKATAFANAGISENDVQYINVKYDFDDGINVYDVEFYAGNTEYDYEINASTGEIISMDKETEHLNMNAPVSVTDTGTGGAITEDQAKSIALADAGISESDAGRLKTKYDYDDGREEYEVEFFYNGLEYSYEINALDGTIINSEKDRD